MPRTIHGEAPRSALRARVVSLPARELLPPGPPPTWAPARRPGSTPRARRSGVLEHLVGDVEVGVHPLHVVELLERLDQRDDLARLVALDPHRGGGTHGELGGGGLHPGRLEPALDALERARG